MAEEGGMIVTYLDTCIVCGAGVLVGNSTMLPVCSTHSKADVLFALTAFEMRVKETRGYYESKEN